MKKLCIFLLAILSFQFLPAQNVGFGPWSNCTQGISGYNPVVAGNQAVYFGNSVSISGNYAIIGGYKNAYIFFYNGTVWVQQAILTPSDGLLQSETFGHTGVCIKGNRAIVGAIKKVGTKVNQGKAYIYTYDGFTWVEEQILTSSDGTADDFFGNSVAINNDYAIVGAPYKDAGAAYIFKFNGTTWTEDAKLKSTLTGAALFGSSVAINGTNALVGAFQSGGSGEVYAYSFKSGRPGLGGTITPPQWNKISTLKPKDILNLDLFGTRISIDGNNAIIGAWGKTVDGKIGQGKAYIYTFNGRGWVEQDGLAAVDGLGGDGFGYHVGINGNYAIIGTENTNAAYIFQNVGGIWRQYQKVTDPGGAKFFSVAIDNYRFLIGAPTVKNNTGMAYFGKIDP
ncbi:MAG: hypothetical protein WAT19_06970 [Ferruginibacter sp.]